MSNHTKKKKTSAPPRNADVLDRFELRPAQVWIMLAAIGAFLFYWMTQSPRPYDDDNIGRYFMAQMAPHKPEFFVNTWGRPMGILLFLVPSQFGYWYCAGTTLVLSVLTCYFVYRTAVITGRRHAWLAAVFVGFQPIFFSTSFSVCTEPIAAFTLAVGMYLFYDRKYLSASFILSLMPLARLEMVVILPLFAYTMFRERKYLPIFLLGSGLIALQIGGMLLTGDLYYLWSQVLGAGHGLYQNGPFDHYFKRFIFIVGPTMFVFLILQLILDIRSRRIDIINLSVVVIFCLHVYFYWKGNVAQIGFLRHFVAIAPLIALWSLDGFNKWFAEAPASDASDRDRGILTIAMTVLVALTLAYYSFDLVGDYYISDQKDYVKFLIVLLLLLLFVLNKYLKIGGMTVKKTMLVSVVLLTVGYTMVKQKPLQLDPEHQTVRNFYDYYVSDIKPKNTPMMVVHTWFFFFDDFNYYQDRDSTSTLWSMRKEKLDQLPVGGLVAWDSHYSWRLVSDVQQEDLVNNPKFKLNRQFVAPNRRFGILLFEKIRS